MTIKNKYKPIIGLPTCIKKIDDQRFHVVGEKYLISIIKAMGGIPIIFPSIANLTDQQRILNSIDGILFTGSLSNVHPANYNKTLDSKSLLTDPDRDSTTLPLIRSAISCGKPILCICRGMQELNVAFGGTLFQYLPNIPGRMDHDVDRSLPVSIQYTARHSISLKPDSLLSSLYKQKGEPMVNSLHSQGVDKLGDGLITEAIASDGQIEAIKYKNSERFALGVQWHPEWQVRNNPFYLSIFHSFLNSIQT
tara:strand:+ start:402 stop:1154 length:753 start_codon:yes stop_codon:yes gene_type:complete